jgi:hypothetical protein
MKKTFKQFLDKSGQDTQIAGYDQSGNAGYGDPYNIQFPKGTGAKPGPGYRPPTKPKLSV